MGIRWPTAVLLLAACVSLFVATTPVRATVAFTSLASMSTASDTILVGQVLRVVEVPVRPSRQNGVSDRPVRLAEVEVQEWIKGAPRAKRVWYLATGTWTSDRSTAIVGETALFFFRDVREDPKGWGHLEKVFGDKKVRERITAVTGKAPLHRLYWSGYGRLPLLDIEGKRHAEIWTETVRLPRDMISIPATDPRYADFIRCVPLDEVRRCVDRRVRWKPTATEGKAAEVLGLMRALDEDDDAADEARDTLGEIGAAGLPAIFGVIEDPESPWRECAVAALFNLGPSGEAALAKGLTAKNPVRLHAAAFALECAAARGIAGEDELGPLARTSLAHPDPEVRRRAVAAMGAWDEDGPLAAIVSALEDEDLQVRRSAARALIEIRTILHIQERPPFARAERGLLPLAKHEDVAVRREAWEALALVAGPAARTAALGAAKDPDRVVRVTASLSLGRVGGAAATKVLIERLASEDAWARRAAAYALGVGKIAAGVDALSKSLADPDEVVVHITIQALGNLGPKAASAVPALARLREKTESSDTRLLTDEALERIRTK